MGLWYDEGYGRQCWHTLWMCEAMLPRQSMAMVRRWISLVVSRLVLACLKWWLFREGGGGVENGKAHYTNQHRGEVVHQNLRSRPLWPEEHMQQILEDIAQQPAEVAVVLLLVTAGIWRGFGEQWNVSAGSRLKFPAIPATNRSMMLVSTMRAVWSASWKAAQMRESLSASSPSSPVAAAGLPPARRSDVWAGVPCTSCSTSAVIIWMLFPLVLQGEVHIGSGENDASGRALRESKLVVAEVAARRRHL